MIDTNRPWGIKTYERGGREWDKYEGGLLIMGSDI